VLLNKNIKTKKKLEKSTEKNQKKSSTRYKGSIPVTFVANLKKKQTPPPLPPILKVENRFENYTFSAFRALHSVLNSPVTKFFEKVLKTSPPAV
jgi:hypothetical protein